MGHPAFAWVKDEGPPPLPLSRYNEFDSTDGGSPEGFLRAVTLEDMRTGPGGRTTKLRRLLITLGITVPIALLPLLVKLPIPRLQALIPSSTHHIVVPLLAAAAILLTAFEEVDNKERISTRIKVARFRLSLAYWALSLILFSVTYAKVVTRVETHGAMPVAYVTGWPDASAAPCETLERADCISKQLTFQDSLIKDHFGERKIQLSTYALEGLYILFFLTLGRSIARLLEVREAARPTFGDRRSAAQPS
jgi:hypothetical protein